MKILIKKPKNSENSENQISLSLSMDRAQVAAYAAHFQQQPPPPQQQPQSSPQQSQFSVSNATLNLSQPTASHPSYAEMIASAITFGNSQGKEGGSSTSAIAKYIDQAYSDLPPTHSALLTHHLKRLTSSSQLVMIKNSYQFPYYSPAHSTTTTTRFPLSQQQPINALFGNDQPATPKRKPGRPAKVKQPEIESRLFGDAAPVDVSSAKRKLGRPAKVLQPEIGTQFVSDAGSKEGVVNENGGSSGKRPRGRPPKEKSPHFQVQQQVDVPFVDLGVSNGKVEGGGSVRISRRPPTKKNYVEQEEEEEEDGQVEGDGSVRKRGRPSTKKKYVEEEEDVTFVDSGVSNGEVEGDGSVRRSGRPLTKKKYVEEEDDQEEPEAVAVADVPPGYEVKRKRGRPAKVNMGVEVGVEKVNNVSGNVYVGKKRGRKPKGSVAVVTTKVGKRLYTGKPRGRPKRKSTYAENTQGQQTTNEELLMMLEEMESKLKDVVRVIKPHLDQCPPDALAALQLLEELSTTDANPSSPVTDPPTMTEPMDATPEPVPCLNETMMPFTESSAMNVPLPYSNNGGFPRL